MMSMLPNDLDATRHRRLDGGPFEGDEALTKVHSERVREILDARETDCL
jgi:hypothetical protein